ncbi:MAG TPA: hypothetical protein VMH77_07575, partial [Steroidobacteraceae bacterium]|nr:hypothetical protein [Steroidobacteraceae bacterium]
DYLPGSRLWLVEWPERAAGRGLPPSDLDIFLEVESPGRRIRLLPRSAAGARWLAAVSADGRS